MLVLKFWLLRPPSPWEFPITSHGVGLDLLRTCIISAGLITCAPLPFHLKERVYLCVKTCEVFLCFVTIMFVLSFVLTSLPLLCFLCSTSLVKVTGFYTEDEPKEKVLSQKCDRQLRI